MATVNLSVAHFGIGTGASGIIDEVEHSIKVSKKVTEILVKNGVKVNYIEDKTSKSQSKNVNWIVAKHNSFDADLDVSIHFNSSGATTHTDKGAEVLIVSEKNRKLAQSVVNAICKSTGLLNRGVKVRTNLGFLNKTKNPAILLEICFVNSSKDVKKYETEFDNMCYNIAKAIGEHLGASFKKPETKTQVNELVTLEGRSVALINKAMEQGIFKNTHIPEKYSKDQLFKYVVTLCERLIK